jgi:hypothetical protein
VLEIPFAVSHTAASPESLQEISRLYYGDAKSAELLRRYNFLDKGVIDKAESLLVPGLRLRLSPGKQLAMDAEARTRRDHRRDAIARAARALPAAHEAWKAADFAHVKAVLAPLEADLDYLDAADAVDLGVLLGAALIAHDELEPAAAVFHRVLDRQAHHTLRSYSYSPKIIEVWRKAGGQVE